MFAAYLVVTVLTAAFTATAALGNFAGHDIPKREADRLGVPRGWMPLLGLCLAAGSLGLLAGFAVPLLGLLAAGALVLYFLGALVAHLRVGDYRLGFWSVFFGLSTMAFAAHLAIR